jgi:hypothetical protein
VYNIPVSAGREKRRGENEREVEREDEIGEEENGE